MAHQQITLIVMQMHAITFAIAKHFALFTFAFTRPFAVAEILETFVPYIHEIVLIDIPLIEV